MPSSFVATHREGRLQFLSDFVQRCASNDCHAQISLHVLMRCSPYTLNPKSFGAGGGVNHIPKNGAAAACKIPEAHAPEGQAQWHAVLLRQRYAGI
jgi:hypothetical protein